MKDSAIGDIRAFNRFYTDIIGLLNRHLLNSPYSLAEARILYEIYHSNHCQASGIMSVMHIDKSYLSRLLKKMEKARLITRKPSPEDARVMQLSLTAKGLHAFMMLNNASNEQIGKLLQPLPAARKKQLVRHMKAITAILQKTTVRTNEDNDQQP